MIISLPTTSILAMIWLWRDSHDAERLAQHSFATIWFLAPSIPMFFLIPYGLRQGWGFWPSLIAGCTLTIVLYLAMVWIGPRFGLKL